MDSKGSWCHIDENGASTHEFKGCTDMSESLDIRQAYDGTVHCYFMESTSTACHWQS